MVMQTRYPHIVRDNGDSEPYIEGTRITVARVVLEVGRSNNLDGRVDKLIGLYPAGYLSRGGVMAALDYYKDNKREIDTYLRESRARSGKIIRTGPPF